MARRREDDAMTRSSISTAAMLALLLAGPALAQSQSQAEAPKADSAKPLARNFEGVWTNATVTRLERPATFSQLVVTDAQAAAVAKATAARLAAANGVSDLSKGA